MFSDKTKSYRLADSKKAFIESFKGQNEKTKKLGFGELLFVVKDNEVYAFKNECPHQKQKLNGCKIHDETVVCPWHQYRFDLKTGRGQGLYLPVYELKEKEDGFFLFRTYFSWFGE